ncbi:MAG: hypothetical protein ABSB79_14580, partial [Syntrophales bacterium]
GSVQRLMTIPQGVILDLQLPIVVTSYHLIHNKGGVIQSIVFGEIFTDQYEYPYGYTYCKP